MAASLGPASPGTMNGNSGMMGGAYGSANTNAGTSPSSLGQRTHPG
jgi:hypothetical protein